MTEAVGSIYVIGLFIVAGIGFGYGLYLMLRKDWDDND